MRLLGIGPGDEVILPAYSFPSCSNAVILAGATPVYVDVRRDTLNLDELLVYRAITRKTRAVMALHYAGVDCDMGVLASLCRAHDLKLIEDAAQCVGAWKLKGDVGCMSFHATKNVGCGEGGAIFAKPEFIARLDVLRDCGLGRGANGERTTWSAVGYSALLGEPSAAVLLEELNRVEELNAARRAAWRVYSSRIGWKFKARQIGNGHIFWLLAPDRDALITKLRGLGIRACSHYENAYETEPGRRYGRDCGSGVASVVARSILRLPTNVSVDEAGEIAGVVNHILGTVDGGFNGHFQGIESEGGNEGAGAERACA